MLFRSALLVQLSAFDSAATAGGRVSWSGPTLQSLLDQTPGAVSELLAPDAGDPWVGGLVVGGGALVAAGTGVAGVLFNQTLLEPSSSRQQKDDAAFYGRIVVVAGSIAATGLIATGIALLVSE